MEIMEDGNLMDRVPILLQRDLEYYQKNQTVLSETVCLGAVGGRLDFPRNASYSAVKLVLWLEDEFVAAFGTGSGLFHKLQQEEKTEKAVTKSSDSDKFVSLAIQSADLLLEHLHVLVQEALDHADLPVLTGALGAAALVSNSLHCYVQASLESGSATRNALLQACYKRYATMSEAVGERMLDLHVRLLSLYLLQDAGGRPIDGKDMVESGSASVQGWWLYMQGCKQDLWETVPPKMAQRIFAGMLNETLTILTVRYCQANTTDATTPLLINDILNILQCCGRLLPAVCGGGGELLGLRPDTLSRHVRDVHAKCNELFKCLVFRGAPVHLVHKAFKDSTEDASERLDHPSPWFTLVSPQLFDSASTDLTVTSTQSLSTKTAVAIELKVLMAQPQPSWPLLVKLLMMRNCYLAGLLMNHAVLNMSKDNAKWPANGLWFGIGGKPEKCGGFLCTRDGYCRSRNKKNREEEYAKAVGALTYIIVTVGSKEDLCSTLLSALEVSKTDWAACLDGRQMWCDRRPPWLAALLATVGDSLRAIPPALVHAVHTGATMYQALSLCIAHMSRMVRLPACLAASETLQQSLPAHITPKGNSVYLQLMLSVLYEEMIEYAGREAEKERICLMEQNGEVTKHRRNTKTKEKHVKIAGIKQTTISSSMSLDGGSSSSVALAIAEALCSIDEGDKHTHEIRHLLEEAFKPVSVSQQFGFDDFPEFNKFVESGFVPGTNAERASDASALTAELLMSPAGRDSLRVIYEHLIQEEDRLYTELGVEEKVEGVEMQVPSRNPPLLYTMFHIGRKPFDQYLCGEWSLCWSALVTRARGCSRVAGARAHVTRRSDFRSAMLDPTAAPPALRQLLAIFNTHSSDNVL